jgi:hypothetical protein
MLIGFATTSSQMEKCGIVIGAGVSGLSAEHARAGCLEEAIVLRRTTYPRAHTPAPRTAGEPGTWIHRGLGHGR